MKTVKTASFHMKIAGFHKRPLARNGNPMFVDSVNLLNICW